MDPHIIRLIRLFSLISVIYENGLNYAKPQMFVLPLTLQNCRFNSQNKQTVKTRKK